MKQRKCRWCDSPLTRRKGEGPKDYKKRRYCNRTCASRWGHANRVREPLAERLARKLRWEGTCFVFTGFTDSHDYGRITVDGRAALAHREAWKLANGPVPDGLYVLHRCDNPPCCNPQHLYAGTQKQNMQDLNARGPRKRNT